MAYDATREVKRMLEKCGCKEELIIPTIKVSHELQETECWLASYKGKEEKSVVGASFAIGKLIRNNYDLFGLKIDLDESKWHWGEKDS